MSIWADKQARATLAAASTRSGIKRLGVDADSVQMNVIAELNRLISIVNTLKSAKPELNMATELLKQCVKQVNEALIPKGLVVQSDESSELESPSVKMGG